MTTPTRTRVVVVAGTGTEVGKTWVAARLAQELRRRGRHVVARKLAQSFDPVDPHPHDADVLGAATDEAPEVVCPEHRWYPLAMAPPFAAAALGLPPAPLATMVAETAPWPADTDVVLLELAGGLRSPQSSDHRDGVDVWFEAGETWDPTGEALVVLVADAGLGTINSTILSADVLDGQALVLLNRYDPTNLVHDSNRAYLRGRSRGLSTSVEDLAERVLSVIAFEAGPA